MCLALWKIKVETAQEYRRRTFGRVIFSNGFASKEAIVKISTSNTVIRSERVGIHPHATQITIPFSMAYVPSSR